MIQDEAPARLHRARPIDEEEVLGRGRRGWLAVMWRWLRRGRTRDSLRRCGAWPLAGRVIDLRRRRR